MKGLFLEFSDGRIDADTEFGDLGDKEEKEWEEKEEEAEEGEEEEAVGDKITSTARLVENDEAGSAGSRPPSSRSVCWLLEGGDFKVPSDFRVYFRADAVIFLLECKPGERGTCGAGEESALALALALILAAVAVAAYTSFCSTLPLLRLPRSSLILLLSLLLLV